jgi:hypothetical protein
MHSTAQFSDLQTFLTVSPLLLLLIASIFKLDVTAANRKTRRVARVSVPVSRAELQTVMADPDGRPWDQN